MKLCWLAVDASTVKQEIDEDRELEESGTKVASVPPCTPTPDIAESEQEIGSTQLDSLADDWQEEGEEKKESKEVEEEEEEAATVEGEEEVKDDAQAKLMSVVSRIATEPSPDYKQDIWQLQLRDLRTVCLECIRWPQTTQVPLGGKPEASSQDG